MVGAVATIGVDLGGTKLLAGALGPHLQVRTRVRREVAGLSLDELLDVTAAAVQDAAAGEDVEAVGFGIPSLIDRRTGISVRCNHLPLDGVAFGGLMHERLGVPVEVDNDANCAMLAEWRAGAAQGAEHAVLLTIGTGIGGGLLMDGEIYRGAVGVGAELGHMVVDLDGPACFGSCPSRGCLEAVASGSALARDAAEAAAANPEGSLGREANLDGVAVTRMAQSGDPEALAVVTALAERLGAGLAGIAMALNPEVIVIGGGVMALGDLLLHPAQAELRRRVLDPVRDVRIVAAAFGDDAGMIGAALMAEEAG
jgi:glucokinase